MECYETCADRGKRCVLPRERISCGTCGLVKPCYNILSIPCDVCPPTEPRSNSIHEKERDSSQKWRKLSPPTCNCKQTCWQWILSFLGFGSGMPECCRNVPLTVWESGEMARQALVSKVQSVVSFVSGKDGKDQSPVAAPAQQAGAVRQVVEKADKKTATSAPGYDSEPNTQQEISDTSPEQISGKEQTTQPAETDKKLKSHTRRSKHRKGSHAKSRSISREKETEKNVITKLRSSSTSSTSLSRDRKHRKNSKSRSRSGSSVKIYNPFKTRQQFLKCPLSSTEKTKCEPSTCLSYSPIPPTSFVCQTSDNRRAAYSKKYVSPSCQNMQTTEANDRQVFIRRSNSMSYKPYSATGKNVIDMNYKCPPMPVYSSSKSPCQTQVVSSTPPKYQVTPTKDSSARSNCTPTKVSNTSTVLGPRASSCLCFTCCPEKQCSCQRTCSCIFKSRSALPRCGNSSSTCLKPLSCCCRVCHPCCTKFCCVSLPKRPSPKLFQCQHNCQQKYSCSTHRAVKCPYVCSMGAGCCCTSRPVSRAPYPTSVSVSVGQNNVICKQLLLKYGCSPTTFSRCPMPLYGNTRESLFSSLTNNPMSSRCPGICACSTCRYCSGENNFHRRYELLENLTNSRQRRSPEGQCCKNQTIEFNYSPCERKPKCQFQLPPHCIRKTGPQSPVREYMTFLRVPNPIQKQDELPVEKLEELNVKATEASVKTAQVNEQTIIASAKGPDGRAINVEANAKPKQDNEDTKSAKKTNMKHSRKKIRKNSEAQNTSGNNNLAISSCGDSNQWDICVAKRNYSGNESMLMAAYAEIGSLSPELETSFNNNYGGDSYRCSRYSSAGPILIDFSELTSHRLPRSNGLANTSASSSFLPHHSGLVYTNGRSTSSRKYDTHVFTSYTPQSVSRDARLYSEHCQFGNQWYTRSTNNNMNMPRQYTNMHAGTTYNRSFNSFVPDMLDSSKASKYNIQLEKAIENKIKELRDSRAVPSPPPRRRIFENFLLEPRTRAYNKLSLADEAEIMQQEFMRESWDTLKNRAYKRQVNMLTSSNYLNIVTEGYNEYNGGLTKKQETKHFQEGHEDHNVRQESLQTRGHHKHNSRLIKDNQSHTANKLPRQAIKTRYETVNKSSTFCLNKEDNDICREEQSNRCLREDKTASISTQDITKEIHNEHEKQPKPSKLLETKKYPEEKSIFNLDCVPVLQSIMEGFEETVQLLARSKRVDVPDCTDKPHKERAENVVETNDNQEIFKAKVQSEDTESNEENQSSNKPLKTTANQRIVMTVSSPPHKPSMVKSREEQHSSGRILTYSRLSNSHATVSTITLEVTHSVHSEVFTNSISDSVSRDTSITYSKISPVSRSGGHPTRENSNNTSASRSIVLPNYLSNNGESPENSTIHHREEPAPSQGAGYSNKPSIVASPQCSQQEVDTDEGSSVDPSYITLNTTTPECMHHVGTKNVAPCEIPNSRDLQMGDHVLKSLTPDCINAICAPSNVETDGQDTSNGQRPPGLNDSMDELRRQLIRKNGTPV